MRGAAWLPGLGPAAVPSQKPAPTPACGAGKLTDRLLVLREQALR